MRPGLFVLPFFAFFVGMIGTASASAFPEFAFISPVSWSVSAGLMIGWLVWDRKNLKRFFRRNGTKFGAGSGAVVMLGLTVIIGIGFISNKPRFNKSVDVTRTQSNTLSHQTIQILKTLQDRELTVNFEAFFQDDGVKEEFRDLLQKYFVSGAKFKVEYISTMEDPTRVVSKKLTSGNTVILSSGSQEARISTFNEEKLTNALIKILKPKVKKIYFTAGHGEGKISGSDPEGFDVIVQQLENDRYLVENLSMSDRVGVPDDADLVVVAGAKYDISIQESGFLESYLKGGGSVLVMSDAVRPVKNLNDFLQKFGVRLNEDLLVFGEDDPRAAVFGRHFTLVNDFDEFNPVTADFAQQGQMEMLIPFVRSMSKVAENEYSMKVTMAAKSSDRMEKITNVVVEKDLEKIALDRISTGQFAVLAVASGRAKNPRVAKKTDRAQGDASPTSAESSSPEGWVKSDSSASPGIAMKHREIRLVAVGSSHFARNQGAQTTASNRDLFMNISNYLLRDDDFISIRPKDFTKSTISLISNESQLMLTFVSLIYPFIFLGFGVFVWLRRRDA